MRSIRFNELKRIIMPKVIVTLSQEDFNTLLFNGTFTDIKYSSKVLPDVVLKDNNTYKELLKLYHKHSDMLNKFIFENTTNK
jgi:hypothetical protein